MRIKTPHLHPSHRRWEPFLLTSTQSWVQWFGLERHHSKQLAQSPGDFSVLVRWNLPLIFQEFQGVRVSKKLSSYFAFFPPPDIRDQLVLLQFSSNDLFNSLPFFLISSQRAKSDCNSFESRVDQLAWLRARLGRLCNWKVIHHLFYLSLRGARTAQSNFWQLNIPREAGKVKMVRH